MYIDTHLVRNQSFSGGNRIQTHENHRYSKIFFVIAIFGRLAILSERSTILR